MSILTGNIQWTQTILYRDDEMKVKEYMTYIYPVCKMKYCGVCWRLCPQLSGTQVHDQHVYYQEYTTVTENTSCLFSYKLSSIILPLMVSRDFHTKTTDNADMKLWLCTSCGQPHIVLTCSEQMLLHQNDE